MWILVTPEISANQMKGINTANVLERPSFHRDFVRGMFRIISQNKLVTYLHTQISNVDPSSQPSFLHSHAVSRKIWPNISSTTVDVSPLGNHESATVNEWYLSVSGISALVKRSVCRTSESCTKFCQKRHSTMINPMLSCALWGTCMYIAEICLCRNVICICSRQGRHISNVKVSYCTCTNVLVQTVAQPKTTELNLFLPATKLGKVIFSKACVKNSVHGGRGIPACLAGLQAHTQGGGWGVWPRRGSPGPHQWGKVEGSGWGVSRPTPRGEVEGSGLGGGLQAYTQGEVERSSQGGSCAT